MTIQEYINTVSKRFKSGISTEHSYRGDLEALIREPAQKWLKDRRGRQLSFEDILHYQKIIVALTETARLMGEIDKIAIE